MVTCQGWRSRSGLCALHCKYDMSFCPPSLLCSQVIATSLPVHEIAGLRQMFMDMDTDRSGAISVREFMIGLQNLGQRISMDDMHSIMQAADMDGNGKIDYQEFLAIMINRAKLQREDNLRKAFVVFDLNGDGRISRNELYTVSLT